MITNTLVSFEEAARVIATGRPVMVAATEALLRKLPRGLWVGGTMPYFMAPGGGVLSHEQVFISELPAQAIAAVTHQYDVASLPNIGRDGAAYDCTFIIVPGFSEAHLTFGRDSQTWEGIFNRPLVGWVSGYDLNQVGAKAAVVDGMTGELLTDRAVVLQVKLQAGTYAKVDIVNIFEPGDGDEITFSEVGFTVSDCFVNGKPRKLAEYYAEQGLDSRVPMVADYSGAMINVAIQNVDAKTGAVSLYGPVFPETTYRVAKPVADYPKAFQAQIDKGIEPVFTCNCILNYLYGALEGRSTGHMVGPISFGEIAFVLLNQTLVHLTFERA